MALIILQRNDVYNIYTSICDSCYFDSGITKDQLISFWKEEYGNSKMYELEVMIKRALLTGCSSRMYTFDEIISFNHSAIDIENPNMPHDEFVNKFLTI